MPDDIAVAVAVAGAGAGADVGADVVVVARLSGISKSFAGVAALTDVAVTFSAGEVHAILGENGAGKSTLMNIICGVLRPDAGVIEIGGQSLSHLTPGMASAAGVAISYQHPAILDDLSVIENLKVALPHAVFDSDSRRVAQGILHSVGLNIPVG